MAGIFLSGALFLLWWHWGSDAGFLPTWFVLSGQAFADRPFPFSGALDQPSLQKQLFLSGYAVVVWGGLVALVGWLSDRRPWRSRMVFGTLTGIVLVQPLSLLTLASYDIMRYTHAVGFTPKRVFGLVLCLAGFAVLTVIAAWATGFLGRQVCK